MQIVYGFFQDLRAIGILMKELFNLPLIRSGIGFGPRSARSFCLPDPSLKELFPDKTQRLFLKEKNT